jgi:hypothetical protein
MKFKRPAVTGNCLLSLIALLQFFPSIAAFFYIKENQDAG